MTHPLADILQARAQMLRSFSLMVNPILATSYRRRACELELELWIHALQGGPHPDNPPIAA